MERECSKCGSYNTYEEKEIPYALFYTATRITCADCGYIEYEDIKEENYN